MAKDKSRFIDINSDSFDALLFGLFCLIGLSVQIILRGMYGWPAITITSILVLCQIGYAFVVWWFRYTQLSIDRASDNFYFLGFIYTMMTLAIALYRYSNSTDDSVLNSVIGDLGIGLMTTIVGLILRIVFSSLRNTPEEIEGRVSSDLQDRAKGVKKNFALLSDTASKSTVHIKQIFEESENVIVETTEMFTKNINKSLTDLEFSITSLNQKYSQQLEANITAQIRLAQQLKELDLPSDLFTSRLNKIFEEISQSVRSLGAELDGVSTGSMQKEIDRVSNELDNLRAKISKMRIKKSFIVGLFNKD